jgi:hypothetical protein
MVRTIVTYIDKFIPGYKTHAGFLLMALMAICQFVTAQGWLGSGPVVFGQEEWTTVMVLTGWFWKMNQDKKKKK